MDRDEWKKSFLKRLIRFSSEIIKFANTLPKTPAGFAIASQIIRSATSVGANVNEAQDASSTKDFLNKMMIALREARETFYWLEVIDSSSLNSSGELSKLNVEANEIIAILVSITKKIKSTK